MAKRPDLVDITSITNSSTINAINQNWDRIQEAFDNTVSLDGSVPNAMNGDLDINGNAILNVGTIDTDNLTLNGQTIVDITSVPEWRSAWVTATSYAKNDLVKINGNVYICLIAHTSGTFATDLTMVKWELMVSKGDSGGGTGDLLAANNLSDVANPATARANLGLGTAATENTVPIAKGGTGATDAATARANLGVTDLGPTLVSLEGLSLVAGDILYATAADTLQRLPAGSTGQVLTLSGGVPSWAWSSIVEGSTITASSQTAMDFTGIPSWVKRVSLHFSALSTNGSNGVLIQLGDAGGFETSSYLSSTQLFSGVSTNTNTDTTGVLLVVDTPSGGITGTITLNKYSTYGWLAGGTYRRSSASTGFVAAEKTLSDTLTQVRVTIVGGAQTFDAGSVRITWE